MEIGSTGKKRPANKKLKKKRKRKQTTYKEERRVLLKAGLTRDKKEVFTLKIEEIGSGYISSILLFDTS